MSANTTAQVMIESMVQIAREEFETGNYVKAIDTATNLIQAIETNDEQTRNTFGQALVPMYCLRAQSSLVLGEQNQDPSLNKKAGQDVARALDASMTYYDGLDAEHQAGLRENIRKTINPAKEVRQASLAAILQADVSARANNAHSPARQKTNSQHGTETSSKASTRADTAHATTRGAGFLAHASLFLLGAALWSIAGGIFYASTRSDSPSEIMIVLTLIPLILVFALAMKGWDWYSQYKIGTVGHFIKFFVMMLLMITVIGFLPIFYWSGRGAARLVGG
jgi:hypothetical protein